MINIQADINVTPESLSKSSWSALVRIAQEGSAQQQDCLIDWGYSSIPAWQFEELFFLAKGEEWEQE